MSISDLFNKPGKKVQKLANASFSTFISASEIESQKQVSALIQDQETVRPPVDYYDPSAFAKFGSAKKYYTDSFEYIYDEYPYDGSSFEKIQWHNSASNLENWVFENIYPRTTGYGIFSPSSIATTQVSTDGYGDPSTKEYVNFYGGPHKDPNNTAINKIFPSEGGDANVYNVTQNRTSNLKFDLSNDGVTVEFWLNKPFLSGSDKEVIFDMWNQATSSVAGAQRSDYGRLRIEMTGAAGTTNPFLVTALSGTSGFQRAPIGNTLTALTVNTGDWAHWAFTFKNNGSNVDVELYKDGELLQTLTTGSALGTVTGSMKANIGGLVTEVSGTHSFPGTPTWTGWGKLSGSIDEFRYWKAKRNPKQIGLNWFSQVNGGTNTDTANTDLGVYFKFNEGIVGAINSDKKVLDYSGRISNGTWVGYSSASRNTGSAFVSAGYREFKDPIIYATNPLVIAAKESYEKSGSVHDANNTARLNNMIPSWIFEDEEVTGNPLLSDLTHILSSYFDELTSYIEYLPKIKDKSYNSGSNKPLPFASRLLRNYGFKYDELFTAATMIEQIGDKSEDITYTKKVSDIKNLLYSNIYNNLNEINRLKGTSTAFRNLLHCLGINEDVISINTYADNITYDIRDNVLTTNQYSRLADFGRVENRSGVIFQMSASNDADSVSFISGSGTGVKEANGLAWTFESEVFFPHKPQLGQRNYDKFEFPYITSSLFGMHTAKMQFPGDTTWAGNGTVGDYANFQVYAVRDDYMSKDAAFVLTGTSGGPVPLLTTSTFKDVYDNSKWSFAVRVKPNKYPYAKEVSGTSGSYAWAANPYWVELYGVNYIAGQKNYEFSVSASVSEGNITNFLSAPKRTYVGAHRTNFTSSVLHPTDVRVKSFRVWTDYITDTEIQAHAKDTNNFGRLTPYRNTALFNSTLQNVSYPQIANLALNWRFDNLTGSNKNGKFDVIDFSSGSVGQQTRYDWAGNISQAKHSGLGYGFGVSNNDAIEVDWIPTQKQLPFENVNSDDDVKVLTDVEDKMFMPDSRPVNYYYTLEKSMYRAISDEMLAFFSTVKDFNNLIGEPVNRYRQEYKALGKLRELFYERVENIPDIEKFVNYYKWFDDAIGVMISNLVPASSRFDTNVNTVIESHVLERNKYWNKFPTIDSKQSIPEASLKGVQELSYDWKFGHAPIIEPWSTKSVLFSSGSAAVLMVPDTDLLSFGDGSSDTPFSISFWTKLDSALSADQYIFSKGNGTNDEYKVYFDHSESKIQVYLDDTGAGSAGKLFPFAPATYIDKWTHIVITYNASGASGIKMYINGAEVSGTNTGGAYTAMHNTATRFRISSSPTTSTVNGVNGWDGFVDEFAVYKNRVLSTTQISGLYNSGCPRDVRELSGYDALVAYWRMGDLDTGTSGSASDRWVIYQQDSSGNGLTATAGGSITPVARFKPKWSYEAPGDGLCRIVQDTDVNCLWWKDRAERTNTNLSSSNNTVQADQQTLTTVITTGVSGSAYAKRALSRPYKLVADDLNSTKKYGKKYENQKKYYHKPLTDFGMSGSVIIYKTGIKMPETCKDNPSPPELKKQKLVFGATAKDGSSGAYGVATFTEFKGQLITPFSMYTGSVGGYQGKLDTFQTSIQINNLHQDTYENKPSPMQGPFTEKYVGGSQHRHIKLNYADPSHKTGSFNTNNLDGPLDRPEGFFIEIQNTRLDILGNDSVDIYGHQRPRANYFREPFAKRPLNIRNIEMTTSSPTKMGNYSQRYEYFQTMGRSVNNLWFRSGSDGLGGVTVPTSTSTALSASVDFKLPIRNRLEDGEKNQTVFAERFSAPGGPETLGRGFLDTESETFSVYNALPYRNLIVRNNLNLWMKHHATDNAKYDAVYASPTASFHHINKNTKYRIEKPTGHGSDVTSSVFDNGFITHMIPQSDANYSWISASLAGLGKKVTGFFHQVGGMGLFGYLPYEPDMAPSSSFGYDELVTLAAGELGSTTLSGRTGPVPIDGEFVYGTTTAQLRDFVVNDFVGINSNIYEPTSQTENGLGYPSTFTVFSYINAGPPGNDPVTNNNVVQEGGFVRRWLLSTALAYPGAEGGYLNSLIHHRQGPYGWPSWKQIRGGQHPVVRAHKTTNTISQLSFTTETGNNNTSTKQAILNNFTESAVTINRPIRHNVIAKKLQGGKSVDLVVLSAYSNAQQVFNNTKLNNLVGISDNANKDTVYNNLLAFYKNPANLEMDSTSNPIQAFNALRYEEIIFPRKKNIYLDVIRGRNTFSVEYWKNLRVDRVQKNVNNSMENGPVWQSIWPLDGRQSSGSFANAYTVVSSSAAGGRRNQPTGSNGELQNQYSIFHMGDRGMVSGSSLFARPHLDEVVALGTKGAGVYGITGDAKWEAADQAGGTVPGPFYETYEQYADALRAVGKGYSIIPEFRMSENMDFYINQNYGNFLTDNPGFLSLTGSTLSSSAQEGFFKTYSTTDFLKHFKMIKEDHDQLAPPSSLRLQCNALMKFLPYKGFYPAQRCLQLGTMFSSSYASAIELKGAQKNIRTILKPLFAPGILYNSIKSAIAVDYPIYTGSYTKYTGSLDNANGARNAQDYDFRVPFESLVDPSFYLAGKQIADDEPHPSASLNSTASLPAGGSETYRLAMHNFLAEVPNFFLENQKLTTFASKDDRVPFTVAKAKDPASGKEYVPEYRMRIVMSHAKLRTQKAIRNLFPPNLSALTLYTSASYAMNPPTITIHRRFASDPSSKLQTGVGYGKQIPIQNARYGSEFGPPTGLESGHQYYTFTFYQRNSSYLASAGEYAPHTPPYYDGYAEAELVFKPTYADSYSISEILSNLQVEYNRLCTGARFMTANSIRPNSTYVAADTPFKNAMQLSSSLNFLQQATVLNTKYNQNGEPIEVDTPENPATQWVIQPKWETPVLDFSNASVTLPKQGTGSVPLGIWHQYGEIPTASPTTITSEDGTVTSFKGSEKGLFISIQDLDESEKKIQTLTGSLADLVGFPKEEKRIGQVARDLTVSEAIVAIPFIRKQNGEMQFYHFPKSRLKTILEKTVAINTVGQSVISMVDAMQRYVIPPQLDFVTNFPKIKPFYMYVFEFSHQFKREDLANIWQNLPPESLMKIKEPQDSVAVIEHPLLINEMLGLNGNGKKNDFKPETQWMVFKVKQKAQKNYYAMTADSKDDRRFKFKFDIGAGNSIKVSEPKYSYNWPYDFFSMVELAELETAVDFQATQPEPPPEPDAPPEEVEDVDFQGSAFTEGNPFFDL